MSNLISAIFQGSDVYSISAAVLAVFVGIIVIVSLRLRNDESPVEGIRRIGEDDSIKTSFQAKQRWLKSATKLIYGTLEKVKAQTKKIIYGLPVGNLADPLC